MLDRQHGKIILQCDGCQDVFETGESSLSEARDKWKEEGWSAIPVRGARGGEPVEFTHHCPNCSE